MNDMKNERPLNQYWPYRILGIIDNFIAILFLFMILVNFAAMGFNSTLLLYLFISLAVLIYTNLTAVFARHVMVRGNYIRMKIKDWIKVNAFVTILFAGITSATMVWALLNDAFIEKVISNYATEVPGDTLRSMLYGIIFFLLICMVLLVVHVIMTFRYLRRFDDRFKNEVKS